MHVTDAPSSGDNEDGKDLTEDTAEEQCAGVLSDYGVGFFLFILVVAAVVTVCPVPQGTSPLN